MTTILPRRGTAAEWTAANPILAMGEEGLETDTDLTKRGDGVTAWTALPYVGKWDSIPGKPAVVAEGATQADARTAIDATRRGEALVSVSDYIPGAATVKAGIESAIAAAATASLVVDFGGVNYVTESTVNVSSEGVTLQNGGIVPTGQFPAVQVSAADVTVRNMQLSRSTSGGYADSLSQRSCVVVNAVRFKSLDCTYTGSALACIYLSHGACNGAVIQGGRMTGASGYQNSCGVYVAAGATGNRNITIRGVHIHDTTDGILAFDISDSLFTQNRVEHLRELPVITVTSWINTTGNVWRARTAPGTTPGVDGPSTDRSDGNTRVLYVDGAQIGVVAYNTTDPAANSGGIDGGYLYINLNGTDPNTVTVTSRIVSGYGCTLYVTGDAGVQEGLTSYNRVLDNYVEDVDGFGIYLQLNNNAGAIGNHACGNVIKNACLVGSQDNSLPYAALGVAGGNDTLLANNTIDGVGSAGKTAPGVLVIPGSSNTSPRGRIVGTTVRNSLSHGFEVRSSGWSMDGCHAHGNSGLGFRIFTNVSGAIISNILMTGCIASSNSLSGFGIEGNTTGIGYISARIIGGAAHSNTQQGILIFGSGGAGARDCAIIGTSLFANGAGSFAQIRVRDICQRTIIDNCSMSSGVTNAIGILVDANAVDTTIGINHYVLSIPTQFNGSVNVATSRARLTVTGAVTLAATSDMMVFLNTGAVPTLPTAVNNYFKYTIENRTGGTMSIATTSSQTIDGSAAPYTLPANSTVILISDSANWRIIG